MLKISSSLDKILLLINDDYNNVKYKYIDLLNDIFGDYWYDEEYFEIAIKRNYNNLIKFLLKHNVLEKNKINAIIKNYIKELSCHLDKIDEEIVCEKKE